MNILSLHLKRYNLPNDTKTRLYNRCYVSLMHSLSNKVLLNVPYMTFCKNQKNKGEDLSTQFSPSDKCVVGEGHERRQVFDEEQDRAV